LAVFSDIKTLQVAPARFGFLQIFAPVRVVARDGSRGRFSSRAIASYEYPARTIAMMRIRRCLR
jgi:hypothetical protein